MKKRPFLFIGLTSFSAALLCSLTTPMISAATVMVAACCLLALSWSKRCPLSPRVTAVACVAAVLITCGFWVRHAVSVAPQLALDGTTATVTVRVEQKVATENAYIVRVESGEIDKGVRLCFWGRYRQIAPKNGDLITAEMELIAAYDTTRESGNTAKANGVYLYAWPAQESTCIWEDGQDTVPFTDRVLYTLRDTIHNTLYRRMSYDTAAISEGMMLGVREHLSATVGNAFRASGVYHLLAVSGVHLSIITAAVLRLLQICHCPRRTRSLITAGVIVLFMALCGFTPSVSRAGVMMLLVLSGNLHRRRADGLNSLGLAATLLLLLDPFCIYDLGWQLSFAATVGLLVFVPIWTREVTERIRRKWPRAARFISPVSEAVGVSLCATLTTAPLSALYFGELSSLFLVGNLLCVPLSSCLLVMNFLSVLTAWCPLIADVLFMLCEWLSQLLLSVTAWLAALPFAMVVTHDAFVILWLFALVGAVMLGYRIRRLRGMVAAVCAMAVVLVAGVGARTLLHRETICVAAASTDQPAVAVITDDSKGLIVTADGDTLEGASKWLHDEGIRRLDWVLWLAQPSVQTVDTAALTVSVERLLIMASPEDFASLPEARVTEVLPEGATFWFGKDGVLSWENGSARLSIDGTDCVVVFGQPSLSAKEWDAELLFVGEDGAQVVTSADAQVATVFCDHGSLREMKALCPDAVFAVERAAIYLIDKDGDIRLRDE